MIAFFTAQTQGESHKLPRVKHEVRARGKGEPWRSRSGAGLNIRECSTLGATPRQMSRPSPTLVKNFRTNIDTANPLSSMKPPSTRTRRRTAFAMLLVWAFALISGVANGCVLDAHGRRHHDTHAAHSGVHDVSPVSIDAHSEGNLGHGDELDAAKEGCLKVCEHGSQSLLKQSSSADLTDPGLAPFVAVAWTVAMLVHSAPCRSNNLQPPSSGPPLRVRLSRLAL